MVGLDGRHIIVRSRHAALNTLLQGAGALVMKKALMLVTQWADEWRLDYKHIGNIHDEFQFECAEKHAERLGKLASYAIQKAGEHYNLRVPLAGTYEIGDSWAETH